MEMNLLLLLLVVVVAVVVLTTTVRIINQVKAFNDNW